MDREIAETPAATELVPKLVVAGVGKVFASSETIAAVQDFSFEVLPGEFVVILGPSGCGKTTVLRMIAGLEVPSTGEVIMDGKLTDEPGSDRGMVFQSYTSFPWLTVKKNVLMGLCFRQDISKSERSDLADYYIELVGLTEFANSYPKYLSGGMRQRVAIARTLAAKPDVLLMDEPFGALDSQTRSSMQEELVRIQDQHHTTVVFVTHDIEEAIFLADRIVISSSRPARVRDIIDVESHGLPRPRDIETKFSPEFSALKSHLHHLIHSESEGA